jgi:hypothetical protein
LLTLEIATNAVLTAILIQASQFSKHLDIPLQTPLERSNVVVFRTFATWSQAESDLSCYLAYRGGYEFRFSHGHMHGFNTRDSYNRLQNPDELDTMVGEVRYTEAECLAKVRQAFTNLGYAGVAPLNSAPEVRGPIRLENGAVPRFTFRWPEKPGSKFSNAEVEVNSSTLRIENMYLGSRDFWRKPWPITFGTTNTVQQVLGTPPPPKPTRTALEAKGVSPEYAMAYISAILPEISKFCSRLGPPFPAQVTAEDISMGESEVAIKLGHVSASLRLRSGYSIVFVAGHVWAVHAPDAVYTSPWWREEVRQSKEYLEPIHFSEQQVADKVRRVLLDRLQLDEKTLFLDTDPVFGMKPNVSTTNSIRRYVVEWQRPATPERDQGQRGKRRAEISISSEVDAVSGDIKTFNFFHKSLERPDPKIDVPMGSTNNVPISQ